MDQVPHSGAGGLTANNDHAVAEYHTVVLETSVCRAVVSIQRERQTLCSVFMNCEWTDIFQPKDNGEQKIHE